MRRWPSLVSATPCGVPFSNSCSRDCVQRCVPWADAGKEATAITATASAERQNAERERQIEREEGNILGLSLLKLGEKGHITGGGDEWCGAFRRGDFVPSHPSHKNKNVARVGHPELVTREERLNAGNGALR